MSDMSSARKERCSPDESTLAEIRNGNNTLALKISIQFPLSGNHGLTTLYGMCGSNEACYLSIRRSKNMVTVLRQSVCKANSDDLITGDTIAVQFGGISPIWLHYERTMI